MLDGMGINHRGVMIGSAIVCLTAVAVIGMIVRQHPAPLDRWVLAELQVAPDGPLGRIGEIAGLVAILVAAAGLVFVAVLAWRTRRDALLPALLVLVASSAVPLLQLVFMRPGPSVVEDDVTYPSGHAAIAGGIALAAIMLAMITEHRWLPLLLVVECLAVLITLVGRVITGEHYVTDVIGALLAVFGIGLLAMALMIKDPKPTIHRAAR